MSLLEKILASKRSELPALRKQKLPRAPTARPCFDLERSDSSPLKLLCEIKAKSPSAGALSTALTAKERASRYADSGAYGLSVLCDSPFFGGSYEDLLRTREGCDLPLLCKEFVIDECQLDAAHAYGASAILLIARCLPGEQLKHLINEAKLRQLVPLVEVFHLPELNRALEAGARVVGVNARDLDTLEMNSGRAAGVVDAVPIDRQVAQLSGVKTPDNIREIASGRANAALVGEILMRQDDPGPLLQNFSVAANTPRHLPELRKT